MGKNRDDTGVFTYVLRAVDARLYKNIWCKKAWAVFGYDTKRKGVDGREDLMLPILVVAGQWLPILHNPSMILATRPVGSCAVLLVLFSSFIKASSC